MQNALVLESRGIRSTAGTRKTQPCRQPMALCLLNQGESAQVVQVRGDDEMHHHLENLGFVSGASLRVIAKERGNSIVEIKGTQIALDRSAASKIITG